MRRILSQIKKPEMGFWCLILIALCIGIAVFCLIRWYPEKLNLIKDTPAWYKWFYGSAAGSLAVLVSALFIFFGAKEEGRQSFKKKRDNAQGDDVRESAKATAISVRGSTALSIRFRAHLRRRYGFFWRRKVRLLLVTGDEAAIEQLIPGLRTSQWLEGDRTVLIYGGSLSSEIDTEKYSALRKLRRGRPLDGIVRVIAEGQNLTPQISDNDLRGLEKTGDALHYSAPVYLWQLCDSAWSQAGRKPQTVGVTLPLRAMPEDIAPQFDKLLAQLREQGLSQIAENPRYDFLLRLALQFEQGGSQRWASRLTPWLYSSQQRVPLRGLMFSLADKPESSLADTTETTTLSAHQHAITFPVIWQGVTEDCMRVRGRRVGMAWEQTLAWAVMAVIGVWGTGMLLSFALNWQQISSVANKAHTLVEHPSVSDYQLTALHDLRNDAGRLRHHMQDGTPWFQRFGLDHNPQLLDAMLPWYGVANNRLIRDPASAALMQKLSALVNSAPNSDQRMQLAKPGYDQLKAWLMMARPDKADGAFYAQTLKAVQPARMGISTGLWQSLSPDLWAFYITELPKQPQWKITPDVQLVSQSRHISRVPHC